MTDRTAQIDAGQDAVDFGLLVRVLRRRWLAVPAAIGAALLIALAVLILREPAWSAPATVVSHAQASPGASQLAGLATQFGLRIPVSGGVTNSPELYLELATSMDLLRAAAATPYTFTDPDGDTLTATLVEVYDIEGPDEESRLQGAAGVLQKHLSTRHDRLAGTIEVAVEAPARELAVQVAERVVALMNEFMLNLRQEQLREEARFIEDRMAEAYDDLLSAEDSLARYLARNRQMGTEQRFQSTRLEQAAALQREMYISLAQTYEQARLEQNREIPLLSMIEQPRYTVRSADASAALIVVMAIIFGGIVGLAVAFSMEGLARFGLTRR